MLAEISYRQAYCDMKIAGAEDPVEAYEAYREQQNAAPSRSVLRAGHSSDGNDGMTSSPFDPGALYEGVKRDMASLALEQRDVA